MQADIFIGVQELESRTLLSAVAPVHADSAPLVSETPSIHAASSRVQAPAPSSRVDGAVLQALAYYKHPVGATPDVKGFQFDDLGRVKVRINAPVPRRSSVARAEALGIDILYSADTGPSRSVLAAWVSLQQAKQLAGATWVRHVHLVVSPRVDPHVFRALRYGASFPVFVRPPGSGIMAPDVYDLSFPGTAPAVIVMAGTPEDVVPRLTALGIHTSSATSDGSTTTVSGVSISGKQAGQLDAMTWVWLVHLPIKWRVR